MEPREEWSLEDLSHDVYLWHKVKLVHLPWFGLTLLAGLFLVAAMPLPWLLIRLALFLLPSVAFVLWINLDGPRLFAQWRAWRRRRKNPATRQVFFAPGAEDVATTATPICELHGGIWMAAAMIQPPPYMLADDQERQMRHRAWASLLNTAAAHGVQVDIFAGRHPFARPHPLLATARRDALSGALAELARWRLRHFTEEAVERGYETTLVVRLVTRARDASEAWHLFAACRSSFAGSGMAWEWVSGAYLAELAYDWADPGAAIRRFVREIGKAIEDGENRDAERVAG